MAVVCQTWGEALSEHAHFSKPWAVRSVSKQARTASHHPLSLRGLSPRALRMESTAEDTIPSLPEKQGTWEALTGVVRKV